MLYGFVLLEILSQYLHLLLLNGFDIAIRNLRSLRTLTLYRVFCEVIYGFCFF